MVLIGLALFGAGAASATAAGCPNESLRGGLSALLPECRAYEMVSPLDKGSFSVTRQEGGDFGGGSSPYSTTVLSGGNGGIVYVAGGAFADTEASTGVGLPYLSTRGPSGWSTTGIAPPRNPPTSLNFNLVMNVAVSADGTRAVGQTPATFLPAAPECPSFLCPLQLYLRDNITHGYRLISRAPISGSPADAIFEAGTPDLSRVLFVERAVLVPGAPEGVPNLYEWIDNGTEAGELKLVGYEPGTTTPFPSGAVPGKGSEGPPDGVHDNRRSISADGRRVFFSVEGQLYLREDGTTTIPVSASQRSAPDPEGPQPAIYQTAETAHGATVFFTSGQELTNDSNAKPEEPDLYRFEVAGRNLTDISASAEPGDVQGVIGASEDGSAVYFAADAQLVPGKGTAGEANVYLWRDNGTPEGSLTYVTTLPPLREGGPSEELNWWLPNHHTLGQQVSDDGHFAVLFSRRALTPDFENENHLEVYRYDAQTGQLLCASCNPDAGSAAVDSYRTNPTRADALRAVSDTGLVAFQTAEALTPRDTNGQEDVYDFDGGRPQLISSGKSPAPSTYMGMDSSGRDLYFATASQLLGSDSDELIDLYDARIGGGIAEPTPLPPCTGKTCRGAASAPAPAASIGSAGLNGAGNLRPSCDAPRRGARQARHRARRVDDPKRARQLRRQAKNLERAAKRCSDKNRRAGK
jgi:hypothetical protein